MRQLSRNVVVTAALCGLVAARWLLPYARSTVTMTTPRGEIRVAMVGPTAPTGETSIGRDFVYDGLLLEWTATGGRRLTTEGATRVLDLVWLDAESRTVAVFTGATPCRARPCRSYELGGIDRAVMSLALPYGDAQRLGIGPGALVRRASPKGP